MTSHRSFAVLLVMAGLAWMGIGQHAARKPARATLAAPSTTLDRTMPPACAELFERLERARASGRPDTPSEEEAAVTRDSYERLLRDAEVANVRSDVRSDCERNLQVLALAPTKPSDTESSEEDGVQ